jgi:hypothetical protein
MLGLAGLCAAEPPGHDPRPTLSSVLSAVGAPYMEELDESIRRTVMFVPATANNTTFTPTHVTSWQAVLPDKMCRAKKAK